MAKGARRCKVAGVGPSSTLVACHDCDLLHTVVPLVAGRVARCRRCGGTLYTHHPAKGLDHSLAWVVTALILAVLSYAYPLLTFSWQGQIRQESLLTAIGVLMEQGFWWLALVVVITILLVPMLELLGLLVLLVPLRLGRRPWRPMLLLTMLQTVSPWGMMDVYLLGVLIAYAKLSASALLIPGLGLFAFGGQMVAVIAALHHLDCHLLWQCLEEEEDG
ncbi:MAG: paraquat-inducible protein A [Magnetococcales bacterium]|nr:paraquat-inducible protein A [Magnetococcales bacterium]NGZ28107.1 paraquat-inducible protein A [Magnetococcales bacterium]